MRGKKHKPTDESRNKVQAMSAVGIPQADIARMLNIDVKTLRLHYRDELDCAAMQANAAVGGALYKAAMSGDVRAQIFWCKTRLRWRETNHVELTGEDGGPLETKNVIEFVDPRDGGDDE